MRKFVITGGPCSGKTTLVNALSERGFQTVSESSTEIITKRKETDKDFYPSKDRHEFQMEIMRSQLEKESLLNEGDIFLDRGLHDGIAYYLLHGMDPPKELVAHATKSVYKKVFLLDMVKKGMKDRIREEDAETAERIHENIGKVYAEHGHDVVFVPAMPVEKRVEFVLNGINK